MSAKYLYGASVQGIQSFIFQTNKLKEIVGASQLIDNINEKVFKDFCKEKGHEFKTDYEIINAAGNIKYIFEDRTVLEKVVRGFPKFISNYAPGITISQAIVELGNDLQKSIDELERKLKAQRNKPSMPVDIGFIGLERARRTGGVGYEYNKSEVVDRGTEAKLKQLKNDPLSLFRRFKSQNITEKEVPFEIEKITDRTENSWIAIIHADGNGLGNILQNLSKKIKTEEEKRTVFSTFSKHLKAATEAAAQKAFAEVVEKKKDEEKLAVYPFRPVILGGDDLTVIIRADLAFDFTVEFLKAFEVKTDFYFKEKFKIGNLTKSLDDYDVKKLTACAGIAYIKDKYPFHYGVHLAESLVKKAKKVSKSINPELAPSSLAFYKVQSSFTENLDKMIERTHLVNEENKDKAGVYSIEKQGDYYNVEKLSKLLNNLENFADDKSKGISKLRQWLSEMKKDEAKAKFMMDRIKSVNNDFYKKLELDKYRSEPSVLKDLIDLHIFKQIYKNNNDEN